MSKHTKEELENLLEDVVNTLDLSREMIEKHGPLGTPPAELVRLILERKDLQIRAFQSKNKPFFPSDEDVIHKWKRIKFGVNTKQLNEDLQICMLINFIREDASHNEDEFIEWVCLYWIADKEDEQSEIKFRPINVDGQAIERWLSILELRIEFNKAKQI